MLWLIIIGICAFTITALIAKRLSGPSCRLSSRFCQCGEGRTCYVHGCVHVLSEERCGVRHGSRECRRCVRCNDWVMP